MRLGSNAAEIAPSLNDADVVVFLHRPELSWDAGKVIDALRGQGQTVATVDSLIAGMKALVREGDHVVFMSNGGFEGAPGVCIDGQEFTARPHGQWPHDG